MTKTRTKAYFLQKEEEKLQRLLKCPWAPETSIRWVRQQIAYIRTDKPFNLHQAILSARVRKPVASYVDRGVHEWCITIYREEDQQIPSPKSDTLKEEFLKEPEKEMRMGQKSVNISRTSVLPIKSRTMRRPEPIKVFDRGKP